MSRLFLSLIIGVVGLTLLTAGCWHRKSPETAANSNQRKLFGARSRRRRNSGWQKKIVAIKRTPVHDESGTPVVLLLREAEDFRTGRSMRMAQIMLSDVQTARPPQQKNLRLPEIVQLPVNNNAAEISLSTQKTTPQEVSAIEKAETSLIASLPTVEPVSNNAYSLPPEKDKDLSSTLEPVSEEDKLPTLPALPTNDGLWVANQSASKVVAVASVATLNEDAVPIIPAVDYRTGTAEWQASPTRKLPSQSIVISYDDEPQLDSAPHKRRLSRVQPTTKASSAVISKRGNALLADEPISLLPNQRKKTSAKSQRSTAYDLNEEWVSSVWATDASARFDAPASNGGAVFRSP